MMALLGLVHPAVRRDAHLGSAAVLRVAGAAAADADRKLFSVDDDRCGERGLDALGHAGALCFVHVGADDERELIAADAEGVVPASDAAQQPRRDLLEQPVAYGVAVGVVYRLKAVEIEVIQHERQLFLLADVHDSAEIALVEQAGQAVRVRHGLELDLLPDVLHDLHDLIDRAVRVPRDREDGQDQVGVLRPAAILDLEIVVRLAQHAAQVFGREQARELGVFRFGQRDIVFGDGLDHFRILSGGRIERLTEAQLAVAVAVGVQIDDGIAVDDAAHALQQAVALHLFALEAQPRLLLAPQAQLALHAQRQHHDDDGEDAERAERERGRLLHAAHRAVHLVGVDDADE